METIIVGLRSTAEQAGMFDARGMRLLADAIERGEHTKGANNDWFDRVLRPIAFWQSRGWLNELQPAWEVAIVGLEMEYAWRGVPFEARP